MDIRELYKEHSIIPLKGKVPIPKQWTKYQNEKYPLQKLLSHRDKFGLVCGFNNFMAIDIDNKKSNALELLNAILDKFPELKAHPITKTQNKGFHIYLRSKGIGKNQKLAGSEAGTMIETRERGGQIVFYDDFIHGDPLQVPEISTELLNEIFDFCKSFDEVKENKHSVKENKFSDNPFSQIETENQQNDTYVESLLEQAVNDDPEIKSKVLRLLGKEGFKIDSIAGQDIRLTRPGKDKDTSTTLRPDTKHPGRFILMNFSSSYEGFEENKPYNMFQAIIQLEYGGDYKKGCKELSKIYKLEFPFIALQRIIDAKQINIKFNVLKKVLYITKEGEPLEPETTFAGISQDIQCAYRLYTSANKVREMITGPAFSKPYDPINEFFKALPAWNGKNNIDEVSNYISFPDNDRELFALHFKKHLIRAVRCALSDYAHRFVFVLTGGENIGKTLFTEWLLKGYSEIFNSENFDPTNKDCRVRVAQNLIINFDDLDSWNKRQLEEMNRIISSTKLTERLPYGRADVEFIRRASFFASSNRADLLTGLENTRWIVFSVSGFDWQTYTKEIDPLQLWAEALHLYKIDNTAGELGKDEMIVLRNRNEDSFIQISKEYELISQYFIKSEFPLATAAEILTHIKSETNIHNINERDFYKALTKLFGKSENVRRDGIRLRRYKAKCITDMSDLAISHTKAEKEARKVDNEVKFMLHGT